VPAGALDVHPAPTYEVAEALDDLGRTERVRAAVADLALVLDDLGMTDRTGRGHLPDPLCTRPPLHEGTDDLRDHVAGLLEDDLIADPDVLAPHLVEVGVSPATVEPATFVGRRWATGVSVPVRPTHYDVPTRSDCWGELQHRLGS
jgi:hypothetical protein